MTRFFSLFFQGAFLEVGYFISDPEFNSVLVVVTFSLVSSPFLREGRRRDVFSG